MPKHLLPAKPAAPATGNAKKPGAEKPQSAVPDKLKAAITDRNQAPAPPKSRCRWSSPSRFSGQGQGCRACGEEDREGIGRNCSETATEAQANVDAETQAEAEGQSPRTSRSCRPSQADTWTGKCRATSQRVLAAVLVGRHPIAGPILPEGSSYGAVHQATGETLHSWLVRRPIIDILGS